MGRKRKTAKRMRAKEDIERLQTVLKQVTEDERRSAERNEKLKRDIRRVEDHGLALEKQTQELKALKRQYEDYLWRAYPKWMQTLKEGNRHENERAPNRAQDAGTKTLHKPYRAAKPRTENWERRDLPFVEQQRKSALPAKHSDNRASATSLAHDTFLEDEDRLFQERGLLPNFSSFFEDKTVLNIGNDSSFRHVVTPTERTQHKDRDVSPDYLHRNVVDQHFSNGMYSQGSNNQPLYTPVRTSPDHALKIIPQVLALSPDGRIVLLPMTTPFHNQPWDAANGPSPVAKQLLRDEPNTPERSTPDGGVTSGVNTIPMTRRAAAYDNSLQPKQTRKDSQFEVYGQGSLRHDALGFPQTHPPNENAQSNRNGVYYQEDQPLGNIRHPLGTNANYLGDMEDKEELDARVLNDDIEDVQVKGLISDEDRNRSYTDVSKPTVLRYSHESDRVPNLTLEVTSMLPSASSEFRETDFPSKRQNKDTLHSGTYIPRDVNSKLHLGPADKYELEESNDDVIGIRRVSLSKEKRVESQKMPHETRDKVSRETFSENSGAQRPMIDNQSRKGSFDNNSRSSKRSDGPETLKHSFEAAGGDASSPPVLQASHEKGPRERYEERLDKESKGVGDLDDRQESSPDNDLVSESRPDYDLPENNHLPTILRKTVELDENGTEGDLNPDEPGKVRSVLSNVDSDEVVIDKNNSKPSVIEGNDIVSHEQLLLNQPSKHDESVMNEDIKAVAEDLNEEVIGSMREAPSGKTITDAGVSEPSHLDSKETPMKGEDGQSSLMDEEQYQGDLSEDGHDLPYSPREDSIILSSSHLPGEYKPSSRRISLDLGSVSADDSDTDTFDSQALTADFERRKSYASEHSEKQSYSQQDEPSSEPIHGKKPVSDTQKSEDNGEEVKVDMKPLSPRSLGEHNSDMSQFSSDEGDEGLDDLLNSSLGLTRAKVGRRGVENIGKALENTQAKSPENENSRGKKNKKKTRSLFGEGSSLGASGISDRNSGDESEDDISELIDVDSARSGYSPSMQKPIESSSSIKQNSRRSNGHQSAYLDNVTSVNSAKNNNEEKSKSISQKFRKPGFWENSDSEPELELTAKSNGAEDKADDDDFDFEFYN